MISNILSSVAPIVDKFIEDKDKSNELKAQLEQSIIGLQKAQADINLAQAKHSSIFVAGARPAIMWICALGLAWSFFLAPIANWIVVVSGADIPLPEIQTEGLLTLTLSLLGLSASRSFEKFKGVARNNLKQ